MDYYINSDEEPKPFLTESDIVEEDKNDILIERIRSAVFKLRSHTDPTGGDYSLGFESGLEMAAGMLENILNDIGANSGS